MRIVQGWVWCKKHKQLHHIEDTVVVLGQCNNADHDLIARVKQS